MRVTRSLLTALVTIPGVLAAQTPDTLSQQGRNILAFGVGLTGWRSASAGTSQAAVQTTGQLASLSFTRYVRPAVAVDVAVAMLDADASASSASARSDAVSTLLFGLSYSPRWLALTPSIRPFVSAAVGPYFHSESQTGTYTGASANMQSRVGGRIAGGVNGYVARYLALQLEADYHAVGKFETVNGVTKDPSGLSLSLGLGFVWGRK